MSIEMEVMGHTPTEGSVESAHKYMGRMADNSRRPGVRAALEQSMRAARDRNPKLLLWLEKAANIMEHQHERQFGQTRRSTSDFRQKFTPTEVQMWQKAYAHAVDGEPVPELGYVYAAAATYAGLIPRC